MTGDDPWADLRQHTSARIALGRTGDALPTRRVLEFQLAHARARDAVHKPLDAQVLAEQLFDLEPVLVRSRADSRAEYLQRPDLGRLLDEASAASLQAGPFDALLVLADGLSARAVHDSGPALVRAIRERCPTWSFAPVAIAREARVALGDALAARTGASLVVMLIGERPGLSAADSLGAYLTWKPRPGETRDSERNCVSNIRPEGLPVEEAARRIAALMHAARVRELTGVGLKEDEALALAYEDSGGRIEPRP